jgi:putative tryptophan/tyrosine transport system substrate-binding protein
MTRLLHRRSVLLLVGGAATSCAAAARAQQPTMPVIGYLDSTSADGSAQVLAAFRKGLNEAGFVEGRNTSIEFRWAESETSRLPEFAADLVRRDVRVIAAGGVPAVLAAKAATSTIPIVFRLGTDPVRIGIVPSLNRPGANLTGVSTLAVELGPKRLELLHELVPNANDIAVLLNPTNPAYEPQSRDIQAAARVLGVRLHVLHASNENEFAAVFAALSRLRVGALLIGTNALFNNRTEELAALTIRHAIPTIYQYREFAEAGGLMSYGGSYTESYRLAGTYTGRILKGEKPADLPVQQSTKVELIINMRTARTLGLTFPLTLLGRADEVIE